MHWQIARRTLTLDRPLVMGILNVTPDSFSDGGENVSVANAVGRAEQMIAEGADIIDVGGESTRPGSSRVPAETEINRVVPVIEEIAKRSDRPISIDTSKASVAAAAVDAGAEIINDISGLRWDPDVADVAARSGAGLVLMHSRGTFETMHSGPPVENIISDVYQALETSIETAVSRDALHSQICLDIGIGFSKTLEQNLELLAKLDRIAVHFAQYPVLIGASRKSFIGKLTGGMPVERRLGGSIASALIAAQKGARILRVHDVAETVQALKLLASLQ